MDHYAKKSKALFRSSNLTPSQSVLGGSLLIFDVDGTRDDTNWFGTDEFSPMPHLVNDSTLEGTHEGAQAQALHSSNPKLDISGDSLDPYKEMNWGNGCCSWLLVLSRF